MVACTNVNEVAHDNGKHKDSATQVQSHDDEGHELVKKEVAEAVTAIKDYSIDQKDQAVSQAQASFDNLNNKINSFESKLRADWDNLNHASRSQMQTTLTNLKRERDHLEKDLSKLEHSSSNAWAEISKGFSESYASLETAIKKAYHEFK